MRSKTPLMMNVHNGRCENHEVSISHIDSDAGYSP